MFTHVGKKIQMLAKIICWVGIASSVILPFLFIIGDVIDDDMFILVIPMIAIGVLMSWLSSLFLYGYGELLENTAEIARNTRKENAAAPYQNGPAPHVPNPYANNPGMNNFTNNNPPPQA